MDEDALSMTPIPGNVYGTAGTMEVFITMEPAIQDQYLHPDRIKPPIIFYYLDYAAEN